MSNFLLSQIIQVIAILVRLFGLQFKKRTIIIGTHGVSLFLTGIHFILLGTMVGAGMAFTGAIRCVLACFTTRKIWLWIFLITNLILTIVLFEDWLSSGLAFFGATCMIMSSFCKSTKALRIWAMIGALLWLIHGVVIWSPTVILYDTCMIISGLIGYYRHEIKHSK